MELSKTIILVGVYFLDLIMFHDVFTSNQSLYFGKDGGYLGLLLVTLLLSAILYFLLFDYSVKYGFYGLVISIFGYPLIMNLSAHFLETSPMNIAFALYVFFIAVFAITVLLIKSKNS